VVAATLYLFAFTATSHAAAGAGGAWAGTLDLLHGVAATLWIGAVTGLALTARLLGSRPRYAQLMARFSLMASALVFVLLATGALGAFVEVATPGQLTDTWYGKTLLVKLGLLVPLLAVAGYNARWGKRRLIRAARGEPRRFVATVTLEAALGLGVMLAAAFLTQTGVAKSVVRASEVKPFLRTGQAADLRMELSIDPNRTGLNTFRVRLQDAAGAPVEAQRTQLVFRYQEDQTVGPATLNLQKTGDGVYLGQGPFLPLEGQWRVEVSVRRADVDDANAFFDVRPAGTPLAGGSANGRWDNPAPGLSWNSFGGFAVLLFGLALALWREQLGRFGRAAALGANTGVLLGFGIGALLLFGVHSDAATSTLPRNPIVADQNSVAAGKKIYEQNCVTCHGLQGVPPRGLNLNPYPLDLTVHVPQHPDGQIYQFIANGFPGTAMKSWSRGDGKLSNDQIWHLVNFLRTLKEADQ
jgi:copper transport protein